MQYRPFGKTGWQVSALGIGTIRLLVIDELKHINESAAVTQNVVR
jgi:predicted aldo/keto reductase-like oxidoreductase